jgi:hypothetical protein
MVKKHARAIWQTGRDVMVTKAKRDRMKEDERRKKQ